MMQSRKIRLLFLMLISLLFIITMFKHFLLSRMAKSSLNQTKGTKGSSLKHMIYSYTATFTQLINQAKTQLDLLNTSSMTTDIHLAFKDKRRYLPASRNYFDEVNQLENLRTVLLNVTRTLYLQILPASWYIVHSNNCTKMAQESRGFTSSKRPKCHQSGNYSHIDFHNLNVFSLLSRSMFRRGTIRGFRLDTDNLTIDYLHIIKDAVVFPTGDIITDNAHIPTRGCQELDGHDVTVNASVQSTHDQVVSISQVHGANFFHFLIQDLPRLVLLLPFLKKNKGVKVHVHWYERFMTHFLHDLGLSQSRMVWGVTHAHTLYIPSGSRCGRPSILQVNILSEYLRAHVGSAPQQSIVLIRRSTKRWFRQHHAILSMLWVIAKRFDLHVEVFSDTALPAYEITRRTFNRALMVVAPHGAGLANLIFSRPGTCVVEGLCHDGDGKVNLCFRDLALVLGHVYHGVLTSQDCMDMKPQDFEPQVVQCIVHMLAARVGANL